MDRNNSENNIHSGTGQGPSFQVPLYQRRVGKEFHASGTWKASKGERRLIEIFGWLFFLGIFIGVFMVIIMPGTIASIILGIGIIGAVGTFVSLFVIAFRKHKEKPMEAHYYSTDYKYNAFTGQQADNSREITKDEFYGNKH